jgi:uncharacterized protein (DUF1697 family)
MADLREICRQAGFERIETYVASGNVVFDSGSASGAVQAELAARLQSYAGKEVGVVIRTAAEMTAVLAFNPFAGRDPQRTYAIFLDEPPPVAALVQVSGRRDEEVRLGGREIYVHYPSGMGGSKLRIPAAKTGTARNMNTVAKLVEMIAGRQKMSDASRAPRGFHRRERGCVR